MSEKQGLDRGSKKKTKPEKPKKEKKQKSEKPKKEKHGKSKRKPTLIADIVKAEEAAAEAVLEAVKTDVDRFIDNYKKQIDCVTAMLNRIEAGTYIAVSPSFVFFRQLFEVNSPELAFRLLELALDRSSSQSRDHSAPERRFNEKAIRNLLFCLSHHATREDKIRLCYWCYTLVPVNTDRLSFRSPPKMYHPGMTSHDFFRGNALPPSITRDQVKLMLYENGTPLFDWDREVQERQIQLCLEAGNVPERMTFEAFYDFVLKHTQSVLALFTLDVEQKLTKLVVVSGKRAGHKQER